MSVKDANDGSLAGKITPPLGSLPLKPAMLQLLVAVWFRVLGADSGEVCVKVCRLFKG
jgi:hypothetical protein